MHATTCVLWGGWSRQHDMASKKRVRPPLGSKGQVGHTTATHRKSPKRVCTFRRCYYRALNGVRASSGMLARLTGCATINFLKPTTSASPSGKDSMKRCADRRAKAKHDVGHWVCEGTLVHTRRPCNSVRSRITDSGQDYRAGAGVRLKSKETRAPARRAAPSRDPGGGAGVRVQAAARCAQRSGVRCCSAQLCSAGRGRGRLLRAAQAQRRAAPRCAALP